VQSPDRGLFPEISGGGALAQRSEFASSEILSKGYSVTKSGNIFVELWKCPLPPASEAASGFPNMVP
jgi:hypothetical protein